MYKVVGLQSKRTARPTPVELLRMYRNRSGLTQSELAQRLGLHSDRMVRKWEKGESLPDAGRLQQLLEVYLRLRVFTGQREEEEAQALWAAVKRAFETYNDKFQIYPIFDKSRFRALLDLLNSEKRIQEFSDPVDLNQNRRNQLLPHNLPVRLDSFVGRDRELEFLKNILQTSSLLTITGPGGAGKTRLALEIARQVANRFKGRVWLVELAGLAARAEILPAVAEVLALEPPVQQNTLTKFLKTREAMLILDNCEHVLKSCLGLVPELLRGCPGLKIIVTSRESLGIVGETLYQLASLSFSAPSHRDVWGQGGSDFSAAVELFIERVKAIQPDFTLSPEQIPVVTRICERLDGLPLAIELVALKIDLLTVEQIEERLDNPFSLLGRPDPGTLPRHRSLTACFDWSYQNLTQEEHKFLQRLSELEGDFSLEALFKLDCLEHLGKIEILGLLEKLVRKSMVVTLRDEEGKPLAFRLLHTVRKYVQENYARMPLNQSNDIFPAQAEAAQKALPDELFKLYRRRSKFTQSQLATLLGLKDGQMVKKWEGGYSLPDAGRLQKLMELYLARGVFLPGKELDEAQQLWDSVKQMFEARTEKPKLYPIFDTGWFSVLLHKKLSLLPTPVTGPGRLARGNLPLQATSFVGRKEALAEVARLLRAGPLITLSGVGGIGKTRLALEVAARWSEELVEEVWLVELATETTPQGVAQSVARTLGVKEAPRQPLVSTLVDYLRSRALVLVLDNCEHLLEACATLVTQLIQNCPQLKILATTRQRLGVAGEINWKVPSLSFPDFSQPATGTTFSPKEIGRYEAVDLFVERAKLVQPGFRLSERNTQAAAQLCYQLEGIPLAIELAAARLRTLNVEQISQLLTERFGLLTTGNWAALPRQQTLRALIDWSYDLLSKAEQVLLGRLSLFAEGFTLEAVETVCAGQGLEKGRILELLEGLVVKSLVVSERQGTVMCYRILETIRQYGLEKLKEQGEEGRWRDFHLDYYMVVATRLSAKYLNGKQIESLVLFEREYPNLRLALDWATERQKAAKALQLSISLEDFWEERGYFSEGRKFLEDILALPSATMISSRGKALRILARLAELQGDFEVGLDFARQSLELAQAQSEKLEIANSFKTVGNLYYHRGNYDIAQNFLNQALVLFEEENEKVGSANSLNSLGLISMNQSNYEVARDYFLKAFALYDKSGDRGRIATIYLSLGIIAFETGDINQARQYYEESAKLSRELGKVDTLAASLSNLGVVAGAQDDYVAAEEYYRQGLVLHRRTGHKTFIINVELNLGDVARKRGQYEAAFNYTQEALALSRRINYKMGAAFCLRNLGEIAINQGGFKAAQNYLQESLTLREELDNKIGIGSCLYGLGNLALARGTLNWLKLIILAALN